MIGRLVLALLFLSGIPANAQEVELGLVTGPAWTSMVWAGEDCRYLQLLCDQYGTSNQPRTTIGGGLSLAIPLRTRLSLQAEALLVGKGFSRTEPTYHLTYLELPVLVRYVLGRAVVRPYVSAGIAPALTIGCKVQYVTVSGFYRDDCSDTSPIGRTHPVARVDLGAVFAGGVRGRVERFDVDAEVRSTRGLLDVEPEKRGLALNRAYGIHLRVTIPAR